MAHSVDSLGMYDDGRFFELLNGPILTVSMA